MRTLDVRSANHREGAATPPLPPALLRPHLRLNSAIPNVPQAARQTETTWSVKDLLSFVSRHGRTTVTDDNLVTSDSMSPG